jgi:hypothetical protein
MYLEGYYVASPWHLMTFATRTNNALENQLIYPAWKPWFDFIMETMFHGYSMISEAECITQKL